jgi:hypothetical protein
MSQFFRINEPDVSAEVFDLEVLAIDLRTGHYHSLRQSAVPLWRLLTGGHALDASAALLAAALAADPVRVGNDAVALVADLVARALLVPAPAPAVPTSPPAWLANLAPVYQPPVFDTYTDMRDLLLIDPIHEVDVTGWPHQPAARPETPA